MSLSKPLVAGERTTLHIKLTCERTTKVNYIEARLEGRQGWEAGSGRSRISREERYPTIKTMLAGACTLPVGVTEYEWAVLVPHDVPPSHEMDPAWARLMLRIRISLPWRIAGRHRFPLGVRLAPPSVVERKPALATSARTGDQQRRLELSLASTHLIGGEVLVGSVTAYRFEDDEPLPVTLSFQPVVSLLGRGRVRERAGMPLSAQITLPAHSAGHATPFQIHVPDTVTFQTFTHALHWQLVASARASLFSSVTATLPLTIVDRAAAAHTPPLTRAPQLGDERVAQLFGDAARKHGWRSVSAGESIEIAKTIGECTAVLTYDYREAGTFVVSRITHQLGLGLRVAPSSALRHVFWRDIEVDIAAWDRAHHVEARFTDQALGFLRPVVAAVVDEPSLGDLVSWSDDTLVLERSISKILVADVDAMTRGLERIAGAIDRSARTIVPPPLANRVDLDEWRALAREFDGKLVVGNLAIAGAIDQLAVAIALEFLPDHAPRFAIAVGDSNTAGEQLRRLSFEWARPASDVLGEPDAAAITELVTRWPASVCDFRLSNGVARVACSELTVARVRELVRELRAILIALSPSSGPYR